MNIGKYGKLRFEFLLLVIFILIINIKQVLAYDIKEYFPVTQGNKWVYLNPQHKKKIRTVLGEQTINGVKTIKVGEDVDFAYIQIDSEGLKKYGDSDSDDNETNIFTPPWLFYPNNLEIGKVKKYSIKAISYTLTGEEKDNGQIIYEIRLENDKEEVKVPAGVFENCLKFSIYCKMIDSNGNTFIEVNCKSWLALGVGVVKEVTSWRELSEIEDKSLELISAFVSGNRIGS